jgi:probable rRNA maturation factor
MAAPGTQPSLDLAFRLEDQHGQGLAPGLQPLLTAAGPLADRLADDHWQQLLGHWLAQLAGELPAELRSPAYSLGLQLTDDASIALLNGAWRQRNEPTDVLSFAAQEAALDDLPAIPLPALPGGESLELGDIVISLETAARQAEAQGHDLPTELLFLASHGLLHLLGWDHPDAASLAAMLARQEALIANA